jgi:DNA-binding transcriptional ArsR family regulator
MHDALKALANETRLKIVGLLALEPRSQAALAGVLAVQPEKLTRHLDLLTQAGIITEAGTGTARVWRLDQRWLRPEGDVVPLLRRAPSQETVAGMDAHEAKTLAAFVRDGRLVRIPVVASKQTVVVRWLAALFEMDATYPERDVNAALAQVHPDVATLRRMLVDHRYMGRQNGIYRRIK